MATVLRFVPGKFGAPVALELPMTETKQSAVAPSLVNPLEENNLQIRWPKEFDPSLCAVHIRSEVTTKATADDVWKWLVRAERWREYYPCAKNVRYSMYEGASELRLATSFRWSFAGTKRTCTVTEYVPGRRLAWSTKGFGIRTYQAWLLDPAGEGCTITLEQTQKGFLALFARLFGRGVLRRRQDMWLNGLDKRAVASAAKRARG